MTNDHERDPNPGCGLEQPGCGAARAPRPGRGAMRLLAARLALFLVLAPHGLTALAEDSKFGDASKPARPNILWITCEDMGPHLGCWGDRYSVTPHLDRFAARSLRYQSVWSNAPVCAPARTALITGLYPTATGAEHMRSLVKLPADIRLFPQHLRDAGWYCTNNSKEDYNVDKPGTVWDESSNKAHYRNRKPGQPFFAVFNLTVTHESRIRSRPHTPVHDPAGVRLPAYHPDTPEVRRDWAQYFDNITTMDQQAGKILDELERDGLADDTIVWFFSDHGSGMPRNKRWPYDCGLHVPLIVHVPSKLRDAAPSDYKAGGTTDRLVEFVDFGPTLLSLARVKPPATMQGEAFLGPHARPPRAFLHGFRGRMDERYDMVRSVGDGRHVYIRNYLPHLIQGQHLEYMFETPTPVAWKKKFDAAETTPAQSAFWKPKPPEELYDLQTDRDEVVNLADSPAHRETLARLRAEQEAHALRIRDVGYLPEHEIHARSAGSTPYEYGHGDAYPLRRLIEVAGRAASLKPDDLPELRRALDDADGAVRYWAALGLRMRGREAVTAHTDALRAALDDAAPNVRIVAGEALARFGTPDDARAAQKVLLRHVSFEKGSVPLALAALNAIDSLDDRSPDLLRTVRDAPTKVPADWSRGGYGIERLVKHITAER